MESLDAEFAGGLRQRAANDPARFVDDEPVKIAWTILLQENDNKVYAKWLIAQATDQMDALTQLWESDAFKLSIRLQEMEKLTIRIMPNSQFSGVVS